MIDNLPTQQVKRLLTPYAWHNGDLSYKLDSLQESIRNKVETTNAKKILILSSRQIGKSYFSATYSLEYLIQNQAKISRIVAPTLKQCQDIVQDNLSRIILDAPPGFVHNQRSSYRWELSNTSSLRMGALERAHVDGNRGGNASLVIYEECGFVDADDFIYGVNSVLGPQLLRSNGREIFVTSPSENPDHPLHTQILPECEDLGTAFRFTVFDSPSITPDKIIEAARRSGCSLTQSMEHLILEMRVNSLNVYERADETGSFLSESFRREYLAEIIRPVTLMVVPAFRAQTHVIAFKAPIECFWQVTIDWGGVRDYTVALLHTYDFLSDTDLIFDERMWPANTPTNEIVKGLREWDEDYPISTRWADVPGQLQIDLANQFGYEINLPQKSDWKASVNNLAVRFSTNKIRIQPRCTFLQKTLRAAMFNKNRTDFERSSELGHCDGIAALMYAVRSQDRTNPYENTKPNRDYMHYNASKYESADGLNEFASTLNPKRSGRFK